VVGWLDVQAKKEASLALRFEAVAPAAGRDHGCRRSAAHPSKDRRCTPSMGAVEVAGGGQRRNQAEQAAGEIFGLEESVVRARQQIGSEAPRVRSGNGRVGTVPEMLGLGQQSLGCEGQSLSRAPRQAEPPGDRGRNQGGGHCDGEEKCDRRARAFQKSSGLVVFPAPRGRTKIGGEFRLSPVGFGEDWVGRARMGKGSCEREGRERALLCPCAS
jgi:hypothetical protein